MPQTAASPAAPSRTNRGAMTMLLAGGVAIGSSPIFVRLSELGPLATGFWRLALAVLPLILLARRERGAAKAAPPLTWQDCARLTVPGIFIAIDLSAWHLSLYATSVANATLIANLAPIFVTLAAWLLFSARVGAAFIAGMVVAVAGVIVLTDMFGGTPSNLAISVMEAGRVEVIAGMNLPMLIKLSSVRKGDDMQVSLDEAQAAGRKYINVASQLLASK